MKIYTSYFSNYRNIDPEIQCISIANSKPKSLFIPKWEEAIPLWLYVKSYKNKEISFEVFSQMYLNRLIHLSYSYDFTQCLEHFNTDVCLMCWEKDVNVCHRKILAEFLQKFFKVKYLGEL